MDRKTALRIARCSWMLPLLLAAGLAGCGSTTPLPPYETPLARMNVESVRTTAYTHTESDHLAYGNHNALGGTLRAAAAINDATLSPNSVAVAPPTPIILRGRPDAGRSMRVGSTRPIGPPGRQRACGAGQRVSTVPGAVAYPITPGTPLTEVGRTGSLYENRTCPIPRERHRQCGRGLVAVARGHGFPHRGHRTGLPGGRLRLGPRGAQHHRPVPAHARRDERLGRRAG